MYQSFLPLYPIFQAVKWRFFETGVEDDLPSGYTVYCEFAFGQDKIHPDLSWEPEISRKTKGATWARFTGHACQPQKKDI